MPCIRLSRYEEQPQTITVQQRQRNDFLEGFLSGTESEANQSRVDATIPVLSTYAIDAVQEFWVDVDALFTACKYAPNVSHDYQPIWRIRLRIIAL